MGFLPRHFGPRFLTGEAAVYVAMQRLCPDYDGGFWDFLDLTNGGFYMRLRVDDDLRIAVPDGNGFDGVLSADAAGIVATLFALNHLAWQGAPAMVQAYDRLRAYAEQHPECGSILAAID